jgi:hypothetical protein
MCQKRSAVLCYVLQYHERVATMMQQLQHIPLGQLHGMPVALLLGSSVLRPREVYCFNFRADMDQPGADCATPYMLYVYLPTPGRHCACLAYFSFPASMDQPGADCATLGCCLLQLPCKHGPARCGLCHALFPFCFSFPANMDQPGADCVTLSCCLLHLPCKH